MAKRKEKTTDTAVVYSIRKKGRIYEQSVEENCGHTKGTLKNMADAGYYLFRNEEQITK